MMFQRQPLTVAILAVTLGLAACNSNDDDTATSTSTPTATTTVTVTPSLGKILSGRVVLRDAKTGVDLAPPKTLTPADNGVATFTVPIAKLAAPVLAAVLPTVAGKLEYADEALEKATTITVPVADANKPVLRAAASVSPNANIGVTALTESAVQQAEKAEGGLIAQNINQANTAVKNHLKLNFDVTQAPIVIGVGEFDKLVNAALDTQRRAYATYLATLAKEAQRMNSASLAPAYDMAKVLASDFSDGTFDAKQGTTALSFYNANFVNAWINWVQNFYASFAQLSNIVALNRWYGGFNIANASSVANFPDATPIRTENGIEEYACSGEGRIKSSSGASIYMDFVNQRGSNMNVFWLDYNTGRVSYRPNLATGQTHNQQTYVTHPWLITDNSGACVGIYRPVTATQKTLTFKTNEVVLAGVAAPVDTGNTDTCASLGTNPSTLSAISDFVGAYDVMASNVAANFQVAANGDITLKGQTSSFKEVCINPAQNNGQGYRLITNKGTVLLFKGTDHSILAEGRDYTNTTSTSYFSGNKTQASSPFTCTSQGSDSKLGFANAPSDFCGFSYVSSTVIPDQFTFIGGVNNTENAKVIVANGVVSSFSIENNKYQFACGIGGTPACSGVTFTNGAAYKQFTFNNTALGVVNGASQGITIKNGALIHLATTTVSVNKAACPNTSGTFVTNCTADVLPDFGRVMLKTVAGEPCNIGKVGGVLSASSGVNTISAIFNGEASDSVGVRNATTSAVTAETRSGFSDYTGVEVTVQNGRVVGAFAVSKTPDISFQCVL